MYQQTLAKMYTIPEVADMLRVCSKTVRRMIHEHQIRGTKVRGQWRIHAEDLQNFLNGTAETTHLHIYDLPRRTLMDILSHSS